MSKPVLLLDLGGVLADLGDPIGALQLEMAAHDFWQVWVRSHAVRAFETGRMSRDEFFPAIAAELGYTGAEPFGQRFDAWRLRPFTGIEELIGQIDGRYTLALLSNTNEVHWGQVSGATQVFSTFAKLFLSYETGHHKPEPESFLQVIEHFGVAPGEIVFCDDTARNVEAARELGIDAHCVTGLDGLRQRMDRE